MITKTPYSVAVDLVEKAVQSIPEFDFRISLNKPTGRFFYDPWVIKEEYKGSVWEEILNSLPERMGEARIIKLEPGTCYRSHADIDDRWHMTLIGQQSFLIDLDNKAMYQTNDVGCWYSMDTSPRHSASNFGSMPRYQLVIRKLLNDAVLTEPVTVTIKEKPNDIGEVSRYIFDDIVSPWLNLACKRGTVSSVNIIKSWIRFSIEKKNLHELEALINDAGLTIEYEY